MFINISKKYSEIQRQNISLFISPHILNDYKIKILKLVIKRKIHMKNFNKHKNNR